MLIGQAVAAIQVSLVEERDLPQAVAKLVVLRVEKLFNTQIHSSAAKASKIDLKC